MSIILLNKVTIFGLPKDRQAVFEGLQRLGYMHLIPLQPPTKTAQFVTSEPAEKPRQVCQQPLSGRRPRCVSSTI